MKKKIVIILSLMVVLTSVLSITIYSMNNTENNNIESEDTVIVPEEKEISFTEMPPDEYFTVAEIKNSIKAEYKENILDSNLIKGNKFIYYESKAKNLSEEVKYQLDDETFSSYYNVDGEEMRFVWEYSVENADELLSNTIEQLGLVEILDGSGLYTYSDWNNPDVDYIDVYWVDNNQSFIANLPKDVLTEEKGFILDFCDGKRVSFE